MNCAACAHSVILYPTDSALSPTHILPLPLQTIPSSLTAAGGMGVGTNTSLSLGTSLTNGHHAPHLPHPIQNQHPPPPHHHLHHLPHHHHPHHHHPHHSHHPIQNHLNGQEHHLEAQHQVTQHRFSNENSGSSVLGYNINNHNSNNSNSDIQTPPPSHTSIDSSYTLGLVSQLFIAFYLIINLSFKEMNIPYNFLINFCLKLSFHKGNYVCDFRKLPSLLLLLPSPVFAEHTLCELCGPFSI